MQKCKKERKKEKKERSKKKTKKKQEKIRRQADTPQLLHSGQNYLRYRFTCLIRSAVSWHNPVVSIVIARCGNGDYQLKAGNGIWQDVPLDPMHLTWTG